ncbi:MAG: 30S ribosomal protein S17 [Anaerolineae bacterium]|nr:30S ribosomal protein S17 [Anaerolineae bacterium]
MRGQGRELVGKVVSAKMDKTAVVEVERLARHPMYEKVMRLRKKYKAHDEENACRAGDIVRIVESRPLSREKRWRIEEILERSQIPEVGR